ncbi:hypothetical protein M422DRAFT_212340 [Sphaerobolus stellatus SS14]|uniref:Autophagy-related protein 11 n=1 Tax=Sphaerobolus stellatus (strain SS14) TaxID=990650 RepID=A0A0C9U0V4_SPHS4|nr:hypothetical protein M422DRAFT_212340 [Sphaerobolus stellatus SS14]
MQIYRAEDGEAFQVNYTLRDIERLGSLERFLYDITGVEEDAVLAYLSDGHRLRNENLRDLAGSSDQSIFVFNKHYLDYELEDVLAQLRIESSLQPEIPSMPAISMMHSLAYFHCIDITSSTLESLGGTAADHHDFIVRVLGTIHVQREALRIASTSLDLNVLSISDVFEGFAGGARRELDKQASLLESLDLDLEVISKIKIHPELLSAPVRRAITAGEKARTLGDYVANGKMRQVADVCAKAHDELKKRFDSAESTMNQLTSGADEVRASATNASLIEEAELCSKRAQEASERISDIKAQLQEPRTDENELFEELHKLDIVLRDEVQLISDLKNKSTATIIHALKHVSQLYNHLVTLPQTLSTLQTDFRGKTSFSHIERLHKMLYAYGATLVEIVRRKEFSRFFSQKAQLIAEVMAKLSSSERKQRQIFRGEVHGQLPFEAKGLGFDDAVLAMEITSNGMGGGNTYSIEREDLMILLDEIDKMERSHSGSALNGGSFNVNSLTETRTKLEKLIMRMDSLETSFDKMVEKTIFSASRILLPRRQPTDHTDGEFQELVEQLHELQDIKTEQERQFDEERHALQSEIERLHAELQEVHVLANENEQRAVSLNDDLLKAKWEAEEQTEKRGEANRTIEAQQEEIEALKQQLREAEKGYKEREEEVETLKSELVAVKVDAEANRRLEREAVESLMQVVAEKQLLSVELEDTRKRETELKDDLEGTKRELEEFSQRFKEAEEEHERRMRTQTMEADRMLRDVIAEADGDRAVLEHQCVQLRALSEGAEQQLQEARTEVEVVQADISGLREELQRAEHELAGVREMETVLKSEVEVAHTHTFEARKRAEDMQRTIKDLLKISTAFRDSHCKAYATAQSSSSSSKSIANLAESAALVKPFIEPSPIDLEDIPAALQILSEYDPATLPEAVTRMASTIRKWQKQCKEYRDRARAKISFRNFAKGDLALFLPTRNSISKPWAAFNVSFPHYFLQSSGNLAEQLKTREWIVARITSITEQVVDPKDSSTNPYGLSDGTKFYMLQVEDWTQSSSRRRSSPPKMNNNAETTAEGIESTDVTPTPITPTTVTSSATASFPRTENVSSVSPAARQALLGTRQRTYSAPAPTEGSSLSRLVARDTPPIQEVVERISPSPPGRFPPSPSPVRRPSSPLARVASPPQILSPVPVTRPVSPLVRSSSPLARPASPVPQASSPLVDRVRVSPIPSPSHSRPSSPLATPVHAQGHTSSPLASAKEISRAELSGKETPTSFTETAARAIPTRPANLPPPPSSSSPHAAGNLPLSHATSRRSSSSSRPGSASSIFSARHPFTKTSTQAPKASATIALSDPSTLSLPGSNEGDLIGEASVIPSPEGSPSDALSSVLHGRRRTTSTASYGQPRSSPLSVPSSSTSRPQSSQSALANLASSWGFGRQARHSIAGESNSAHIRAPSTSAGTGGFSNANTGPRTSTPRSPSSSSGHHHGSPTSQNIGRSAPLRPPGSNDILRRYDDILPQERR